MNILGLHFGHDASVAVIKANRLVSCLERERVVRLKHAIGLTRQDVAAALDAAGLTIKDIDYCAITSTQNIEYIFPEPESFSFSIDGRNSQEAATRVLELAQANANHPYVHRLTDDLKKAQKKTAVGSVEDFIRIPGWEKGRKLSEIGELIVSDPFSESMAQSMQVPVTLKFDGRQIPGWLMSHHFAHAACAFYLSEFESSDILTQDGSLPNIGYWNGMCYYGTGKKLYPIMPHHLNCGRLYEGVSVLLGLGLEAGPGKMMGLAPYGKTNFFDSRFAGNMVDALDLPGEDSGPCFDGWKPHPVDYLQNKWIRHIYGLARKEGYDLEPLGDTRRILEPINADIAAATQLWLEETMLKCARVMFETYRKRGWNSDGLCLSGGVALNCPANSRIFDEGPYKRIFVPPAVHDGGLSVGAALAVLHNTLGEERSEKYGNSAPRVAYLGLQYKESDIEKDLLPYRDRLTVTRCSDAPKRAAARLANNEIIAIFQGRSEVGPRALGHRSLVAHPGFKDNWKLVNTVKQREQWRPLAPAVLESKVREWFSGGPDVSPFMLFTASAINDRVPAVTHVDGSARIQTVNEEEPFFFELITEFEKLTGIPVVMNTSLNAPGEPIIETGEQALRFFSERACGALYLAGYEITKNPAS